MYANLTDAELITQLRIHREALNNVTHGGLAWANIIDIIDNVVNTLHRRGISGWEN